MKSQGIPESELVSIEATAGLEHAFERKIQKIRAVAQQRWEQGLGGKQPADACVSVTIATAAPKMAKKQAAAGGILKRNAKSAQSRAKKIGLPHFAR
jgi:hypothetical protein